MKQDGDGKKEKGGGTGRGVDKKAEKKKGWGLWGRG